MHALALSTCWNSHRHTDGEALLEEIRALGFEAAELSHGIRLSLWPGVLRGVKAGTVRINSVHNFCPLPIGVNHASPNCYLLTDPDPTGRAKAVELTCATIRNAAMVGARAVVLHLGWAGPGGVTSRLTARWKRGRFLDRTYVRIKLDAVQQRRALYDGVWQRLAEGLEKLGAEARACNVRLGIEMRECFEEFPNTEELPRVLEALPADVFGYWHDFGHAARQDFLSWHTHAETLARLAPRLLGCHLHDANPPDLDHQPMGTGQIDWPALIAKIPADALCVLEPSPRTSTDAVRASAEFWRSCHPEQSEGSGDTRK